MRTVSSERSDGEKLQITKLAQHDEREKRLLEKKRITRFAQNTENNTQNITKMTHKKNDWGYGALQKIKAGVIQKHATTLYKTKKMNYEYDTRHLQKRKTDNTNELLRNDMILKRI